MADLGIVMHIFFLSGIYYLDSFKILQKLRERNQAPQTEEGWFNLFRTVLSAFVLCSADMLRGRFFYYFLLG